MISFVLCFSSKVTCTTILLVKDKERIFDGPPVVKSAKSLSGENEPNEPNINEPTVRRNFPETWIWADNICKYGLQLSHSRFLSEHL